MLSRGVWSHSATRQSLDDNCSRLFPLFLSARNYSRPVRCENAEQIPASSRRASKRLAEVQVQCDSATKPKARRKSATVVSKKASLEDCRKDWLLALSAPEVTASVSSLEKLMPGPNVASNDSFEEDKLAAELATLSGAISSFDDIPVGCASTCVLGIDPDVSGALAVLRTDEVTTAEVFDVPSVKVMIGMKQRRRHDARSIVALINRLKAPHGSVAYVEQSMPFPKDGKQGWWGSGFGFGMWIGILVASGFSVVPVPSTVWKRAMALSGRTITKDDCRASASLIFPSLASQLKRKKDHGRAEALLIAAFGKGIPPPLKHMPNDGIVSRGQTSFDLELERLKLS